jgi:hypothetical protein
MAIRWTITDRATLRPMIAQQPQNRKEADNLKAAIKNLSRLGQRGGCLHNL